MLQKIVPNLWFDTEAEEAAAFYASIFENSRVVNVTHYTEAGPREAGMATKRWPSSSNSRLWAPRCSPSYSSFRCPAWVERRLSTTPPGPG